MIIVISYMTIYHSELIVRKSTSNNQLHLFGMGQFEGLMVWKLEILYKNFIFKNKK